MNFTLPFPPSVNALYGGGSAQRRFKSKGYKAWEAKCPELAPLVINKPVRITLTYFLPDKRARDLDNYGKAVFDRLVHDNVILDDNFNILREIHIRFGGIDKGNPRVEIEIALID